jgi:ferredoxin-NADP reductase
MRARIAEKREVAEGTLFVVFDLLGQEVEFVAGQYFWVELPDRGFTDDDERGLRRHVSVATSPTERGVLGLATRVRDSAFKQTLAALEVGDEVDVEQPKGDFLLPEETDRPYAFVAGGIGISVFRSMLRCIADLGLPHRVTLVFSNRDRAGTAFLDELQELERRCSGLRVIFTMTEDPEWDGETRLVDETMLRDVLGEEFDETTFLVAGPPGMVDAVVETLEGAGLPEEQIRPDRFSGY